MSHQPAHQLGRRARGFLGAVTMLVFVALYAFTAMVVAQAPAIQHAPILLQTPIYAVLGLAWILPLLPLIKWMERGETFSWKERVVPKRPGEVKGSRS